MASINIANEIAKALSEYTDEIEKGLEAEKKKVADKAVQTLKATSPKGATGKYAKGWGMVSANGKYTVCNKTSYQITHLLEYGHVKRNGGRTESFPHIRPVEEQAVKDFTDGVKKVIQG